jgi:hypothetical protein
MDGRENSEGRLDLKYTQGNIKLPHLEIGTYRNCIALLFFRKIELCKGQLRFEGVLADWVL